MKAEKYLESIGLENVIDEEFFNDDDKSWYKVQELMEAYHQAKLDLLNIPVVSNRRELLNTFRTWWWGNREKATDITNNDLDRYLGG